MFSFEAFLIEISLKSHLVFNFDIELIIKFMIFKH